MTQQRAAILQLKEALGDARQPELSHTHYDRAHEVFERCSSQQALILRWFEEYLSEHLSDRDPLKILSIGCGNGILDNLLIESISTASERILEYTGADPNVVAAQRFRDAFRDLELPRTTLHVAEETVETFSSPEKFDLIHAVQSLYYFADPAAAISSLMGQLAPGGKLIVFQAPKGALNQLADCFWFHRDDVEIWFSGRLEAHLEATNFEFTKGSLMGRVDVTACSEPGNSQGLLLLDFITQTSCKNLAGPTLAMVLGFLQQVSAAENGRTLAPHPVDVFTITQKS